MSGADRSLDDLAGNLQNLAQRSLVLWDLPEEAMVRLINVSENFTYLVESANGFKAILRVHRERYHSRRAIECELAWLDALSADEIVATPQYYLGHDGHAIQKAHVEGVIDERYMVLFHFVKGQAPKESDDMIEGFEQLGVMAARCHRHVTSWQKPENFERLTWDLNAVFGDNAIWGNWRDAPQVNGTIKGVLNRVEVTIKERLARYGKAPERYNLIHADMRFANLLIDEEAIRLIDFDDSGFGWFMYDFAAAVSFMEDDPRIPLMKAAWLSGYRCVREISAVDEAEIDTFIMLRRMALLAWIGSHIEAPEPQALAPGFAAVTAALGEHYLQQQGVGL